MDPQSENPSWRARVSKEYGEAIGNTYIIDYFTTNHPEIILQISEVTYPDEWEGWNDDDRAIYLADVEESKRVFDSLANPDEMEPDEVWSAVNYFIGPDEADNLTMMHPKEWGPKLDKVFNQLENQEELAFIRQRLGHGPVDAFEDRRRKVKATLLIWDRSRLDDALIWWQKEEEEISLEWERLGKKARPSAPPPPQRTERSTFFKSPDIIKEGERDTILTKMAGSMFRDNYSFESVLAAVRAENLAKCNPPKEEKDVLRICKSIQKKEKRRLARGDGSERKERFTDQDNTERIIEDHGEDIRYIPPFGDWAIFDGCRWLFNAPGGLHPLVRETTQELLQWAISLEGEAQARALKNVTALQSGAKQKVMIEMAATYPEVIIQPSQLDQDVYLLNVHNGTLDLRTGTVREQRPDDLITKLAPVAFDQGAGCPEWLKFLDRIMNGNVELIGFIQRAIGYCLTGLTGEQCFFFLYGTGANGKSTLLNTIKALLGDYAMQSTPEILMSKDKTGGASPELARLPGARFVATSETEDGRQFAEAALKQMTGQDTITARHLFKEFFEFRPQFKIWFATNHKPIIRGTDNAIWRRIHLIPFNVAIPEAEQDRDLEKKLLAELPGILNWALEGCRMWQEEGGLKPPAEVKAAVKEYKDDMDVFGQWLDECCILQPGIKTPHGTLYESYDQWSKTNSGWSLSSKKFSQTLTERGLIKEKSGIHSWRGIGLLDESRQGSLLSGGEGF